MAHAVPAPSCYAVPLRRTSRDRRDAALAIAGLALASAVFGAVVSGDPVAPSDAGRTGGQPAAATAGR